MTKYDERVKFYIFTLGSLYQTFWNWNSFPEKYKR